MVSLPISINYSRQGFIPNFLPDNLQKSLLNSHFFKHDILTEKEN